MNVWGMVQEDVVADIKNEILLARQKDAVCQDDTLQTPISRLPLKCLRDRSRAGHAVVNGVSCRP